MNIGTPAKHGMVREALRLDNAAEYLSHRADHNGWAALHYAAAYGEEELAKLILGAGADKSLKSTADFWVGIDFKVPAGSTAAGVAKLAEFPKIVAMIDTYGESDDAGKKGTKRPLEKSETKEDKIAVKPGALKDAVKEKQEDSSPGDAKRVKESK